MRTLWVIVTIVGVAAVASGLGVLIWWLVDGRCDNTGGTIVLEGALGDVPQKAAWTSVGAAGQMFWWFYPTGAGAGRPVVLWLDGVTGLPPSLLANLAMVGPLNLDLNARSNSWVDDYNLLFVDAPLGTGFSTANNENSTPQTMDANIDHLVRVLEAFYSLHEEYSSSPLYLLGQSHGAQLALALAVRLSSSGTIAVNLSGVIIGNGIVSPALAVTKLGFYLEEMGYVDPIGRQVIEEYSTEISALIGQNNFEEAFDKFLSLEQVVNEEAGTVAVNLGRIVDRLTRDTVARSSPMLKYSGVDTDVFAWMETTVAPALGMPPSTKYDAGRDSALQAFRRLLMVPAVNNVEQILSNTNLSVAIYNGNLDAVSTTPGQLEWVNGLQWSGQQDFLSQPRQTLVVGGLVQGYFRETDRLKFYWVNAAGESAPLDSPDAMRRIVQRIITE